MLMIQLKNVYQNAHCQIKHMVQILLINVYKFVQLVNSHKIRQECVCIHALMDHMLTLM
jgi:hypothetical protein